MSVIPAYEDFAAMYNLRHGAELAARFKQGRVAVAGLGGLGSHVALALARCGVGALKLIDFDRVDLSNLGRQAYGIKHIGLMKTEALREIIHDVNPYAEIESLSLCLEPGNISRSLTGWPLIVEAFDRPEAKAALVGTVLSELPEVRIICASGLAGLGKADNIRSRKISDRLYLCGDEVSAAEGGQSLMAPRVMVCAGQQANLALRLLAGLE